MIKEIKGNGTPEGQRMNFRQRYVSGLCGFDAIDDEIAAWHESEEELELGEYLGFSAREYAEFLQKGAQDFEQYLNHLRNVAPAPGGWDLEPFIRRDLVTPGSRVHCIWDEGGQWVSLDYASDGETGSATDYSIVFAETYEGGDPDEKTWEEAKDCARTLSEELGLPLVVERYDATAMQNMLKKVLPRYASRPDGVKELIRMGFSPEHLRHFGVKLPGSLNTEIQYLYRDASNFKLRTLCVLAGALTEAEKEEILECLIDGEYFVPGQAGLPDDNRYSGTEDDTDWFELESIEDTDHSPTLSMTAQELLENFRKAKGNWYF